MNELEQYLSENPTATLTEGGHDSPECGACILEVCSLAMGVEWTDDPERLNLPDIRPLNDAEWSSDTLRTQHLTRVGVAVWAWRTATEGKKATFTRRLAELTIRRVIPPILNAAGLTDEAERCRKKGTADAVRAAANAAYYDRDAARAAARAAANAARAAANAAYYARDAANAANAPKRLNADDILIAACDCWIEAAQVLSLDNRS